MSWIRDITQCPRCGYENARSEEHLESWSHSVFCIRCGYSTEYFFNYEKYDSLGIDSCETDDNKRNFKAQCWEREVICPTGSYIYRRKGDMVFTIGSIEAGSNENLLEQSIESLLEHLDEYDICRYTFYKVRSWYIKDLHENTTTFFSEDEYHKCGDDLISWSNL